MATRERVEKGSVQAEIDGLDFDSMTGANALATQDDVPAGPTGVTYRTDTDFEAGDTALPRLRLAQGLTAEVQSGEAKPGQWVLSGFDAENEVVIIPLMRSKHRNLRDQDNNILCSSPDGNRGYGTPGGACAVCPMAQWKNGATPQERVPDCDLVYGFGAWSVTHQSLVSLDMQRTAIPVAQLINTILKSKGMGNVGIVLTAEGVQKGNRIFHKPKARVAKGIEAEDFDMAKEMAGVARQAPADVDPDDLIDAEAVTVGK